MATPESSLINQHIQKQLNRQRYKSFVIKIAIFVFLLSIILIGTNLYFNTGKIGFREKVMTEYNFSPEVKWYIRLHTNFELGSITGGFGEGNHAGLFDPKTRTVFIATANAGLALHEMSHAWWSHKLETDPSLKGQLINDTIKLSKMEDADYKDFAIPLAKYIIDTFCHCPDTNKIDISAVGEVDGQHFFTTWVEGLTNRWDKDWKKYLPEFMWKYFEDYFDTALLTPKVIRP